MESFHFGLGKLKFLNMARSEKNKGFTLIELLVVIASWPEARDSHWRALLPARAIENQCYLVGVNRVGADPHVTYAGHSVILDPKGVPLATCNSQVEVLSARIEREPLVAYREKFPALADTRGEFLGR